MKNVTLFPDSSPALNQFIKLYRNPEFQSFIAQAQKELYAGAVNTKKGMLPQYRTVAKCKQSIRAFIHDKQLPSIWIEPIYSIISKKLVNLPPDNGISIKVGDEDIANSNNHLVLIRNSEGALIGDNASVSIVISTRTSTDFLLKFIKDNSEQIQYWIDTLKLPEHQHMPWKRTLLALEIIRMKDEGNMTFDQISNELVQKDGISQDEEDFLATTENIKTLYYRYKKLLQSS